MFLNAIQQRNPGLVRAAVDLHQAGKLPPNTWVFDLDTIAHNADILAAAARKHGLTTYVMTKQNARNPMVSLVAIKRGLYKTVAVDIQGAKIMHRYGVPIGHIGHLNQIPRCDVEFALRAEPDVITIYSVDAAEVISAKAKALGRHQDLLLRVVGPKDLFFEGQEGGILEQDLDDAVRRIRALPNVSIAGVTSFPCMRYNPTADIPVEPTPNFHTIVRAAQRMREMGIDVKQINAPGNTSSQTFPILAEHGATHVEPGHGLLGTTPNHAFKDSLPELPAYVYLTEVSHFVNQQAYTFGGGFWSDIYDPSFVSSAFVGRTGDEALQNVVRSVPKKQIIDYHGALEDISRCRIGDSVVFGFRTQMQMTRSHVAVVAGISTGSPEVVGLFNHAGTMVTFDWDVIPTPEARERIQQVVGRY
ncbi:alanine racemase [Limnochorda pilosa]|uniref:Amino acid racemase n=1 Tax=Limnochorda pilosa TaxID=1555112 RepID=A0A0K2SGN9_LIMPI|nr:alanine racemase [Limnochorda pilosa]BAS26255.1 amino acid racemase [Limnochorda pilosa]